MDPDEGWTSGPARGTVETGPGWRSRQARAVGGQPEWAAWRWFSGRGRSVAVLGVFVGLVALGLLVQRILPGISLTSLLVLALGVAFGGVWLIGGVRGAFVPAIVLVALALARLVVELGVAAGDGWTGVFVGLGLLAAWMVGHWQGVRREWALWLGLILILIGLAQISLRAVGFRDLGLLWPALIVLIGGALLIRSRSRAVRPRP
ncbi:MAG: hypothetical protein M3432_07045 [Chloroflexota bacterium]|nr:hypothetical protein [Chloroflexota bacterium]